MSAAKKKEFLKYPSTHGKAADKQETNRIAKMQLEKLQSDLQKRILDNPKTAKKAALLISYWIKNNECKQSKK